MRLNIFNNFGARSLTILICLCFLPVQSHAESSSEEIKIESTSKSSSSHRVILSNVTLGQWVVCWGMDDSGTPLAKGDALVKGTFVEVMVRSSEHHEEISRFFCEYEK